MKFANETEETVAFSRGQGRSLQDPTLATPFITNPVMILIMRPNVSEVRFNGWLFGLPLVIAILLCCCIVVFLARRRRRDDEEDGVDAKVGVDAIPDENETSA